MSNHSSPVDELLTHLQLFGLSGTATLPEFKRVCQLELKRYAVESPDYSIRHSAMTELAKAYGKGHLPFEPSYWQTVRERMLFPGRHGMAVMRDTWWSFATSINGGTVGLGMSIRGTCRICLKPQWEGASPHFSHSDGELWVNVLGLVGKPFDWGKLFEFLRGAVDADSSALAAAGASPRSIIREIGLDTNLAGYLYLKIPFRIRGSEIKWVGLAMSEDPRFWESLSDDGQRQYAPQLGIWGGFVANLGGSLADLGLKTATEISPKTTVGISVAPLLEFPIPLISRPPSSTDDVASWRNPEFALLYGPSVSVPLFPIGWLAKQLNLKLDLTGNLWAYRSCLPMTYKQAPTKLRDLFGTSKSQVE